MINKKSIWFLTLFSLILVLSVYYITMPSELLLNTNGEEKQPETNKPVIKESTVLVALRVEEEEKLQKQMTELQSILTNKDTSTEQKNEAFEKLKGLNVTRGEEEALENKINEEFKLKSFVKIEGNQIRIVVDSKEHDSTLANNIMRSVQANYEAKMYISVKFATNS